MRAFLKWLARRRKLVYRSHKLNSRVALHALHSGKYDLDVSIWEGGNWHTYEFRSIPRDDVDDVIPVLLGEGAFIAY